MMATGKSKLSSFAEKLRSPGREEGQRMKDLQGAIELVTEQLNTMKAQDRSIMKQFADMRSEINRIKEGKFEDPARRISLDIPRIAEEEEFSGAKDCILDPFDVDDNIPLRRRAITTVDYASKRIVALDCRPTIRHKSR